VNAEVKKVHVHQFHQNENVPKRVEIALVELV